MTTRVCRHCDEGLEYIRGVGWVETAEGGHYDICPGDPAGYASFAEPDSGRHRPV